jgi:nucleoid-associated protein EbfC
MKNLGQMMKQAQEMQTRMAELQERLIEVEMTGGAAGGMVQVTLNGKGDMRKVKIDKSLVNADETEVLEDLIVAATNDAKMRVETFVAEEMAKLTGGLKLPPGMKLPF